MFSYFNRLPNSLKLYIARYLSNKDLKKIYVKNKIYVENKICFIFQKLIKLRTQYDSFEGPEDVHYYNLYTADSVKNWFIFAYNILKFGVKEYYAFIDAIYDDYKLIIDVLIAEFDRPIKEIEIINNKKLDFCDLGPNYVKKYCPLSKKILRRCRQETVRNVYGDDELHAFFKTDEGRKLAADKFDKYVEYCQFMLCEDIEDWFSEEMNDISMRCEFEYVLAKFIKDKVYPRAVIVNSIFHNRCLDMINDHFPLKGYKIYSINQVYSIDNLYDYHFKYGIDIKQVLIELRNNSNSFNVHFNVSLLELYWDVKVHIPTKVERYTIKWDLTHNNSIKGFDYILEIIFQNWGSDCLSLLQLKTFKQIININNINNIDNLAELEYEKIAYVSHIN